MTLSWKASDDDGGSPITGYIVEKKASASRFWSKVEKVSPNTLTLCVTGLEEKTEYLFRVIAENKAGESEPLETKDATLAKSPFSKYQIF